VRARPILPVLLALAVATVAAPGRPAAAPSAAGSPRVVSRHAILVDAGDGAVLWGRGSRTPRPPASLTKMLTALAVRASLDLDEQVGPRGWLRGSRPAGWPSGAASGSRSSRRWRRS
jgi:D-alanyl-D-alanine carboxypeptidase